MSNTVNLKEKTLEGLKALAYDVQKVRDNYQSALVSIEQEILLRTQQDQTPDVPQADPQVSE